MDTSKPANKIKSELPPFKDAVELITNVEIKSDIEEELTFQIEKAFSKQDLERQKVYSFISLGYRVTLYIDFPFKELPYEIRMKVLDVFCTIFNEKWGESWDTKEASEYLTKNSLRVDGIPIVCTIDYQEHFYGFFSGKLKAIKNLNVNDFPFYLSLPEKKESLERAHYFYKKVLNQDTVFISQEVAIVQSESKISPYAPFLYLATFKYLQKLGCNCHMFWTKTTTKAFEWSLFLRWYPFHYFVKNDLVLIHSNVSASLDMAKHIFPDTIRRNIKKLISERDHYLCKTKSIT